ncbi:MAG: tetratricopeptide repeat protein, partial [Proteobacteria bacterium]|nr:tetratricopeptide repeat protein [Pseudomonadota bacterium]
KFRKDFAESLLVDDAVYLIAYMEFLKGDYDQSALKFHEMIEQFPESNKLNDAKWWLGVSFERTGDINAAIDNYKLLLELAPENPIRVKAELRLEEVSTGQNP